MPVFEYKCQACGNKFDFLHKSVSNIQNINCPKCGSEDNKKLLSTFSASTGGPADFGGGCSDGSCGVPAQTGGCSSGLCGLN